MRRGGCSNEAETPVPLGRQVSVLARWGRHGQSDGAAGGGEGYVGKGIGALQVLGGAAIVLVQLSAAAGPAEVFKGT